ncbi:MAG: DUF58 domain-containing protein [Gemmatimonas sp.]|nr:DUF58 domain-containing protein [Gemmatimonas sp.]
MRSALGEVREMILTARARTVANGEHVIRHSGRQCLVEVSYRLGDADGPWVSMPSPFVVAERVVNPPVISLREFPLPFRLTGLTGMHASARPGDGGEFRDLHPYAPGDRVRRIDWKATPCVRIVVARPLPLQRSCNNYPDTGGGDASTVINYIGKKWCNSESDWPSRGESTCENCYAFRGSPPPPVVQTNLPQVGEKRAVRRWKLQSANIAPHAVVAFNYVRGFVLRRATAQGS